MVDVRDIANGLQILFEHGFPGIRGFDVLIGRGVCAEHSFRQCFEFKFGKQRPDVGFVVGGKFQVLPGPLDRRVDEDRRQFFGQQGLVRVRLDVFLHLALDLGNIG